MPFTGKESYTYYVEMLPQEQRKQAGMTDGLSCLSSRMSLRW